MRKMKIKKSLQAAGLRTVYDYVDKDPRARLPQVVSLLEKFVPAGSDMDGVIRGIKEGLADPDNNWNRFVLSLWDGIGAGARRALFENFARNGSFLQSERNDELRRKYNCNIPWTMLIDPTSACSLHCTGCWAAEHGNRLNLSYAELEDILRQGKELGIHFYLFSGGEPLVRKADILRLCQAHPDCEFSAFTNGTIIDEAFADEMLRVKNFLPAISVEGFEEATDSRRGAGTFRRVERAMALLRERKLPFGISCCYTRQNVEVIGSEAYFDQMIAWGAKFCWFFTYMPVGSDAVPDLMVTPEQRRFLELQALLTEDTCGKATGIESADDKFGSLTCIAGTVHTKDGRFVQTVDSRYPTTTTGEAITERMTQIASEHACTYRCLGDAVPFYIEPTSPEIRTLLDTYGEYTGTKAEAFCIGGGTYARHFKRACAFGPHEEHEDEPAWVGMEHGPDEGVSEADLKRALKIYIVTIARLMELDLA